MIKLTVLHYKIKTEALERFHNISQYNEELLFNWEEELEKAKSMQIDHPIKPFVEPFEFDEADYEIIEQDFRIRSEDILYYKTNLDGVTEVVISENIGFTVKETVEEIDKLMK